MKIEETIAYKQGMKAAKLGTPLEQSGLVNLNPDSERYDQFIAGYDNFKKIVYSVAHGKIKQYELIKETLQSYRIIYSTGEPQLISKRGNLPQRLGGSTISTLDPLKASEEARKQIDIIDNYIKERKKESDEAETELHKFRLNNGEKVTCKVKMSMNGLRAGLTNDAMELRSTIEDSFDHMTNDHKEELIEKFDEVACGLNSLNCVFLDGDDSFTDMNELEVKHLGEGY
jgi:hypothetical protein